MGKNHVSRLAMIPLAVMTACALSPAVPAFAADETTGTTSVTLQAGPDCGQDGNVQPGAEDGSMPTTGDFASAVPVAAVCLASLGVLLICMGLRRKNDDGNE